jgi:hypothetical protein
VPLPSPQSLQYFSPQTLFRQVWTGNQLEEIASFALRPQRGQELKLAIASSPLENMLAG